MSSQTRFISEPQRKTEVKAETEVLVIGGGTAGVSAAITAARNGAEVILVERLGYLGGLAIGGLIALLLTLNSILANSVSGGNCSGTVTDGGYNISDDVASIFCPPGVPVADRDKDVAIFCGLPKSVRG